MSQLIDIGIIEEVIELVGVTIENFRAIVSVSGIELATSRYLTGQFQSAQSRVLYRLRGAGTNEVYTFNPGEEHMNPEDGQIFKFRDAWMRWTAPN